MRRLFLLALFGAAVVTILPAGATQPPFVPKPVPKAALVVVPAPGVPGGQVKLVPRDQLRVGPGVKTARLDHKLRAGLNDNSIPIPASWDWTTRKDTPQVVLLPIYGNDQYGDCYYVTLVKMFILYQWQVQKSQLSFDKAALINRYLRLSGGDNGLSDSDVFPELKGGVIGPGGPHKALDVLVLPTNDKTLMDLTGYAFGPHMFTFSVYSNFSNGAKPGAVFTSSSGGLLGGHAVPLSGKRADGMRALETWGMQPSIWVSESWIKSVDGETITVFSNEWFDPKTGYAPNGQHYQTLAALWNSIGGHVDPVGPFPSPNPTPPVPPIPVPPPLPPATTVYVGPDQDVVMLLYGPKGEVLGSTRLTKGSIVLHPKAGGTTAPDLNGFTGTLTYEGGALTTVSPGTRPADFGRIKWLALIRDGAKLFKDVQEMNLPAMVPLVEKFWTDLSSFNVAALAADVRAILAAADGANFPVIVADVRAVLADLGLSFGALGIQESELVAPKPGAKPPFVPKSAAPRGIVPAFALAF